MEQTQARGLKDWSKVVQKGSSISSVLNADRAFVRLAAGHWVLTCLKGPPSEESDKPLPRESAPTAESQQHDAALERELETIERRLTKGTIKYAAFVVLRDVGPKGARPRVRTQTRQPKQERIARQTLSDGRALFELRPYIALWPWVVFVFSHRTCGGSRRASAGGDSGADRGARAEGLDGRSPEDGHHELVSFARRCVRQGGQARWRVVAGVLPRCSR